MLTGLILALGILAGQIVKIPFTQNSGATLLDLAVLILCLIGTFQIKFKFKKIPSSLWLFIAFVAWGLISLIISPLKLTIGELTISASYGIRFLLFVYLGVLIKNGALENLRTKVFDIFIISGFLLSVIGILQLIFLPNLQFLSAYGWDPHYFRTVSTLLDPNFLGAFLSLILLLLLTQDNLIKNVFYKITFALLYLAILTTFSRSAAICLAVSLISFSVFKKNLKYLLISFILLAGYIPTFFLYHQFISAPRNIDRTQSAEYRLTSYTEGLDIFSRSPITGVGFNGYRFALTKYNLASSGVINSHGGSTNDSSFLYILDTTGVVGLVIYLAAIYFSVKEIFIRKSKLSAYYLAGFLGLAAQSFFINVLFYPWILVWIFIFAYIT